ncbi:DUF349 domain-containing protein [Runella sp.]|jgi:hypothetical protein|uniref:DUF349 domain-containing protein n=1 Tax=Runella sp. TaxID=1960881 RepID=UPI0026123E63|nr:DUF349 domain-containing protein [Runella sp.]
MINDGAELSESEQLTQESVAAMEELEVVEEQAVDYSQLDKKDFVSLLENQFALAKSEKAKPANFKRTDELLKEVKVFFDQIKKTDRDEAERRYVAENGSEEGFDYKPDELTQRFESLYRQIKDVKNHYFQDLEKSKDKNFVIKTQLLQRLRELVDADESNAKNPGTSWQEFKKIQDEWKAAGNIASPHNSTLWATFHALIDRYYSNRNIYYELKELDRKKNLQLKGELVEKVEALAQSLEGKSLTRAILEEANAHFDEYKHIGPGPKAEQEVLWQRMKVALDTLHDARRAQTEDQKQVLSQNYEIKSKIYEDLVPFTAFTSSSINEWNEKTKEVVALQEQWVNAKGQMLREEGRELSKKFWATLKTFFHNKGEFFRQLESKREQNLKLKTELCEAVEAIIETGEDSAANTDKVIALQKQWKQIGQVPEKFKDTIFDRFKKACDAYFDRKRAKNSEVEREFVENLAQKQAICEKIEAGAKAGEANLKDLNAFKSEWSSVGFVPKKDMQAINKRYIDAVNSYVSAIGKLSSKEREQVILENEVAMATDGESVRNLQRKETDIRRRMTQIENDLTIWQNNIEFFGRSKNGEKVRAEFEKKIIAAQKQLADLKHQLKIVREAL